MVATLRCPKASYSALSTAVTVMPIREAVSLSICTKLSTPFSARSLSTFFSTGLASSALVSFCDQVFRSAVLSAISVY